MYHYKLFLLHLIHVISSCTYLPSLFDGSQFKEQVTIHYVHRHPTRGQTTRSAVNNVPGLFVRHASFIEFHLGTHGEPIQALTRVL